MTRSFKRHWRRYALASILCSAAAGFSPLMIAQDDNKNSSDAAKQSDSQQPPKTDNTNKSTSEPDIEISTGKTTNERFTPSEEVSQDMSVAFPVDI